MFTLTCNSHRQTVTGLRENDPQLVEIIDDYIFVGGGLTLVNETHGCTFSSSKRKDD